MKRVISDIAADTLNRPDVPLKFDLRYARTSFSIKGTYDSKAACVNPNLTNFFCSISFELGQSYMMSFPNTGVVSGE